MHSASDRYLIFEVGTARLALDASVAREVLPIAPLHRPLGAPTVLAGFLNLGGEALPVISMAVLLGSVAPERTGDIYRHIIRLAPRADGSLWALLVDRVLATDARADGLLPLDADRSVNGVMAGTLTMSGSLVPLIDLSRLLLSEEQSRVADLAKAAQARLAGWGDPAP